MYVACRDVKHGMMVEKNGMTDEMEKRNVCVIFTACVIIRNRRWMMDMILQMRWH